MTNSDENASDATTAVENQELSAAASKAFDFAQDVTKQVLTLSTGIIALTITFFKDFANHARAQQKFSWAGLGLPILSPWS